MTTPTSSGVNVAVIYYSATGNVYEMAQAAVEGAQKAGATEVRLAKVRELAPQEAIATNQGWAEHVKATQDVPVADLDLLEWADVLLFGTPTRYGSPTAQLRQFLDTTGPLWSQGKLADKVVAAFTSTATAHGGQESTLLNLYTTFYHWGCIIVPPGYLDPVQFQVGNPYGASHISANGDNPVGEPEKASTRFTAQRAVETAAALKRGRQAA
ncbi:MAG TPA: NAD(P)H:quinone oxidoreductase [Motilibacteraceae bacterium]|nr:NAD(P)H:quinone oxidoreductase [Motilibacteraceae bacterium]